MSLTASSQRAGISYNDFYYCYLLDSSLNPEQLLALPTPARNRVCVFISFALEGLWMDLRVVDG